MLEIPSPFFFPPPPNLKLLTSEIHVVCAILEQSASLFDWFIQTLSVDERMKADRFYFEQDREYFIVRRGILRTILGYYLNVEPDRLQFCYRKHGKPALADAFGNGTIYFNLSHSDGVALYAFTRYREIGVDIERIRDISGMNRIAEQFFSRRETDIFCALPEREKKEAFLNCWTRKEAFIKAIGEGLSLPLDEFEVSLLPGEPAKLVKIEGDSKAVSRWTIQELKPAVGFVAALAVEGQDLRLHCWQWLNSSVKA